MKQAWDATKLQLFMGAKKGYQKIPATGNLIRSVISYKSAWKFDLQTKDPHQNVQIVPQSEIYGWKVIQPNAFQINKTSGIFY